MADTDEVQPDILTAEDIETLESLVYSEDRLKFLTENFAKTDEAYWFYRILTLQNHFGSSLAPNSKTLAAALDKVAKVEEVQGSQSINNLLLRQAIINFEKSTYPVKRQTIMKLKSLIKPTFALQEEEVESKDGKRSKALSSKLELTTKVLLQKAWIQFNLEKRNDIQNVFTAVSAEFLANQNLNPEQIGDFLDLVENEAPEIPFLPTYIRKDLENNDVDFGDRTIHFRMTKEHLDLMSKTKQCQQSENYMKCYAWKLRRVTDVSYKYDIKARAAYLKDLKAFADKTLDKKPQFNSLKALIIYNWLIFQERQGQYDKRVLKQYLKIPRAMPYCQEIFARTKASEFVDLDYFVDLIEELDPIEDDEPYVRRALRHIFQSTEDTHTKWKDVVDLDYLRKVYCETKLTKGQGKTADLRRAYGRFGKYAFQDLCNNVNLELLRSNPTYNSVEESVSCTILVKNVPELEVRIYQVDCKEYFLRYKHRISLDIPLEGLTPNYVIRKQYNDPPLLQRARTIELTQLRGKRGVFLIEFFGNGHKTRALVRKGELRHVFQQDFRNESGRGIGYQFRVFDELNRAVARPEIYMDGVRYSGENGIVFVPFASEDNATCPMILEDTENPGSATIHTFDYKTENYRLECGMFIDRESLLEKHQAEIVVRPALLLNEVPVSVENLKNVQLIIETTDAENFNTKRVVPLTLQDDQETTHPFTVPTELRVVKLTVTCDVYSPSQERDLHLDKEEAFTINDIDSTNALADMHLVPKGSSGYVLAVLGKNGEPYKDVVVEIECHHRYFTEKLKYKCITDENGQISLGRLPDVTVIQAVAQSDLVYQNQDEDTKHKWILLHDQVNVPTIVNVQKGQTVRIPFMTNSANGPKIDVYDIDFVKCFKSVAYKNGYIEIKGLPSGIFQAFIRDAQDAEVLIHVSKGEPFGDHIVSNGRIVELSEEKPLQITEVKGSREDGYSIQIQGGNDLTRVHILSSHLVPRFSSYSFLASPEIPPSVIDTHAYPALYGVMAAVSDEFKYIGARKHANKYSGNLLERPSLLNKRWTTAAPVKQRRPPMAQETEFVEVVSTMKERIARKAISLEGLHKVQFDSSNLEFLSEPSKVHFNLRADKNGVVNVPGDAISPFQNLLQIIAVDDDNTCLRNVILQDTNDQEYADVTLNSPLDPAVHWTEMRQILELKNPGDTLLVDNFATSEIETYDDISDVFELYTVLSGNKDLASFKFLTVWNELSMEQKLEFYDIFVCNEVNFYVYRKDTEFFNSSVAPLLRSKVQKGFMDLYMLGDDVSAYASVTKYQSLNTLERILLANRVPELAAPTVKYLQDSVAGIPVLPQESDSLFKAALEAKQLSVDQSDAWEKREDVGFLQKFSKVGNVIEQTREYQETRYFKVPFEQQTADLVPTSRFWLDYALFLLNGGGEGNYLSREFHTPTANLTQMLLGLCVTDLPFRSDVQDATIDYMDDGSATLSVNTATLVLSRQIKTSVVQTSALSVSTNYFDPEDQFEVVDFERQDKFLKMPLLTQKVYGCRVVITNVSSMSHTVELLSQIPEGSIPVCNGFRTKNTVEKLDPYTTKHREFYFYFPNAGSFTHYQTRVSKNGKVIGYGKEDHQIEVVDPETVVDTSSWDYFSVKAENDELKEFLTNSPEVHTVDLNKIAWRMMDEKMFLDTTTILRDRQIYNETIWAYSMKHFAVTEVKEFLSMDKEVLELISPHLDSSDLADYDAFDRQAFQIMEYWPLTAPRAHHHTLANEYFQTQYREYLKCAFYRSYSVESMTATDKMTGVYYFLIQNRVQDALELFEQIKEGNAREISAFTYDYLRAYLAFYSQDVTEITKASELCDDYLAMILTPSKKAMWQGVQDYLNELKDPNFASEMFDNTTDADISAARAKRLNCEVNDDQTITINYKNIENVEINFYQTDIEFQFSTAPFRQQNNAFNFVAPTETLPVTLDKSQRSQTIDLPPTLHDKSSVVEVIGGGKTVSRPNYDNRLRIEISARLRQIRVFNKENGQAIAKAYVKVYGQTPDSPDGRFIKDGYTDLRGRFDYASVSSDELDFVKALAILVLSPSAGADVLEVTV